MAAGLAAAGPMDGDGWHHCHDMDLLHGVDLSEPQRTQVDQIRQAGWAQLGTLVKQDQTLRTRLSAGLLAGAPPAQLTGLMQQQEVVRNRIDAQRLGWPCRCEAC